jgi:hypothetical protein
MEWWDALKTMGHRDYWSKANTVEFFAFVAKGIIVPSLPFKTKVSLLLQPTKNL